MYVCMYGHHIDRIHRYLDGQDLALEVDIH